MEFPYLQKTLRRSAILAHRQCLSSLNLVNKSQMWVWHLTCDVKALGDMLTPSPTRAVLMLTSTFPRFPGDSQANFVGEQAQAWLDARPADRITILAPGDIAAPKFEQYGKLEVERFSYIWPRRWQSLAYPAIIPNIRRNILISAQVPSFLYFQLRAAKEIILQKNIKLTYAHWVVPQGLIAWHLKRALGVEYVLQNHSSDLDVLRKFGSSGLRLARAILAEASHFFCVNSTQAAAAASLLEGAERAAFERKCTVLPMGIAQLPPLASSRDGIFDMATIGRLSRKKGLDHLIHAAELLAQRGVRPHIGIAGDGEERAKLEKLVRQSHITFTGFLAGEEKQRFLGDARRLVFPAKSIGGDVEGMPVALLEGLAQGRPVLASRDSNITMLPEWHSLRKYVVYVDDPADHSALADALQRLLSLDRYDTGETSRVIARYRWENLIEDYLAPIEAMPT